MRYVVSYDQLLGSGTAKRNYMTTVTGQAVSSKFLSDKQSQQVNTAI
jgi:hypothetical protein